MTPSFALLSVGENGQCGRQAGAQPGTANLELGQIGSTANNEGRRGFSG